VNPQILSDAVSFDEVRATSRMAEVSGTAFRVPEPAWSVVLACVHRLAHHQDQERLGWLYDIHLLVAGFETADWDRLLRIARRRQVSAICADGLEAAGRLLGTRIPGRVIESLARAGLHDPSRGYVETDQRRLTVLRTDLRQLRRWRDRARLLREHAFPPASFMMARYTSRRRAWLPAFYVHRLVTGAWKWIRA
jgi:hypothetical protein